MANLDCIQEQRHHFADKGPYSQSYGFSHSHVWMSWTIKKAECQRINALELWCWRSNLGQQRDQTINPKGNQSEYSLEGLMLKLKIQYVGHLIERTDSLENQRRQWQPTPVFLPGKSHGWRSLVGCSPWGR